LHHNDRSTVIDRTIHNNRPDIVILEKTIKEAYFIDVAILNSQNLHSTITEKLQKYTDLKEELARIWQLRVAYLTPLGLSRIGMITYTLHKS